jgi:hypothetical protein
MTMTQLFDAHHQTRDPTQTLQLRKSFRATAKMRLRQLRAAMRVAVSDQNLLSYTTGALAYAPAHTRLEAFVGWLQATGGQLLLGTQWAGPYIARAWRVGERKAMRETGGAAGPDRSQSIVALAHVEIEGILNVLVQHAARVTAGIVARNTQRPQALRQLFDVIDKIAQPRLVVMADVLAIKAYNEAKLSCYIRAGIRRVGVHAESLPGHVRSHRMDAADRAKAEEADLTEEEQLELPSRAQLQRLYEETLVGVLTAGDDKVCQLCEEFAYGAPYEIDEVLDVLPMHPRCRCSVYPWEDARYRGEDGFKDYDPNEPRDPAGSSTGGQWTKGGGGGASEFVSPNIGQGGINEAVQGLKSDRQKALQKASSDIDHAFGIKGERHDAIGAWSDGAEHTIVTSIGGNENWDKLRVSAAMKGHLADQKAVLIFKQDDAGKSALYRMHVPEGDVLKLHENLIKDGLAFHTIVPHTAGGGADVIVADLDGSAHDAMAKAAERYNADVSYEDGQAEFIGTTKEDGTDREQRDDARRAYEEVISQSPVQESQAIWAGVHHTWGQELGVKETPKQWGAEQGVVASRNITSKKSTFEGYARPDVEAMRTDPENFEHDVGLFSEARAYPNFRPDELKGDANTRVRAIVDHMKSNIRFLYDTASEAIKNSGMGWYDKAHDISVADAKTYGIDERSSAGVIATLSPQKDWDQNIYLAHAVLEINHSQQNHVWDEKMAATAERIWIPKLKKNATELQIKKFPQKLADAQKQVAAVQGKKLSELTDPIDKAVWIRTYDEAHSDRTYTSFDTGKLAMTNPTKKNPQGVPKKAAWQSTPAIAAAVESMDSKGDLKVISAALGEKHKVRSFYNNIVAPRAPNGDVTVDTHAVGVALARPLSGKASAVMQALATSPQGAKPPGWQAASSSKVTGIKGTYPIYADAYREVASELGILPQQLQAVTWQAKRELFKISVEKKADVEREWASYHDGKQDLKQTQQNVLTLARSAPHEESEDDD